MEESSVALSFPRSEEKKSSSSSSATMVARNQNKKNGDDKKMGFLLRSSSSPSKRGELSKTASASLKKANSTRAMKKSPKSGGGGDDAKRGGELSKTASSSLMKQANSTRSLKKIPKSSDDDDGGGKDKKGTAVLTPTDIDVLRGLDSNYVAAQQSGLIGEKARRAWAFRSAVYSVIFICCYMTAGILFFRSQTDWGLPDTLLFAVYSATSAGYGHLDIPSTPLFQMVDTCYVLIGIASMAIMVAQLYQYIWLEAARARDNRRAAELARNATSMGSDSDNEKKARIADSAWAVIDRVRPLFRETTLGRFLSVFLPLAFLALSGACIIGIIEGWTFVECIYFGVISLTTTGYGDYYPTKTASILICAVWLPFNIMFTSIYMGSVATWYLDISDKGIQRIRKKMHADLVQSQAFNRSITTPGMENMTNVDIEYGLDDDEDEEEETANSDVNTNTQNGTKSTKSSEVATFDDENDDDIIDVDGKQPAVVLENLSSTLITMADVIDAVQASTEDELLQPLARWEDMEIASMTQNSDIVLAMPETTHRADPTQPSFKLRVLVKERLATILARDLVGGEHHVDVQDTFIVVRIGQWKQVVAKWLIPSGAWKAFRAAALDAIMLVGERNLIQQGPEAVFQLSPDEFHSIFSPLVAAMGDAETLQGWLNSTDHLAKDLSLRHGNVSWRKYRKLRVDDEGLNMPKSAATAFHKN